MDYATISGSFPHPRRKEAVERKAVPEQQVLHLLGGSEELRHLLGHWKVDAVDALAHRVRIVRREQVKMLIDVPQARQIDGYHNVRHLVEHGMVLGMLPREQVAFPPCRATVDDVPCLAPLVRGP